MLVLEIKIYCQWMSGGQQRLSKVASPSNHLSVVGKLCWARPWGSSWGPSSSSPSGSPTTAGSSLRSTSSSPPTRRRRPRASPGPAASAGRPSGCGAGLLRVTVRTAAARRGRSRPAAIHRFNGYGGAQQQVPPVVVSAARRGAIPASSAAAAVPLLRGHARRPAPPQRGAGPAVFPELAAAARLIHPPSPRPVGSFWSGMARAKETWTRPPTPVRVPDPCIGLTAVGGEREPLAGDKGYTCCLAMDGVKILCSGFEKAEKAKIEELVTAMGGLLQSKSSMDVNFVIVKDVMAAKYKYAVNIMKKPVVTMNWLEQCWIEHRVVPHEPYRIPPFAGLNICITKLNPVERKELEKIIVQNGGQFSACLTKKCTHLVANKPGGDKYVVAQKWGNIHIVNPRWVEQSVARRACLDENTYLVCQSSSASSGLKSSSKELHNPEISSASASFQPISAISVDDSVSTSQYVPASFCDASKISNTDIVGAPGVREANEMQIDSHIAEDSEAENDDLYLSNCRISLVGFEEKDLLRLLMMIRNGGGSRHILLNEKLTHIILGVPSEDEKKEVRRLAAWGVINVVKVTWLEDCDRAKKEVKVSPTHVATDLLLKEFSHVTMEKSADTRETKVAKSSCGIFHVPTVNDSHDKQPEKDMPSERKPARGKHESSINKTWSATRSANSSQHNGAVNVSKYHPKSQGTSAVCSGSSRSNIFEGRTFGFSNSFSHEKRPEVVDWIRKGGGIVVDDIKSTIVDYIIECHGRNSMPCDFSNSTVVSTQWVHSCLKECCLQDVGSHPIFSPLRCRIPFPGFEKFKFCITLSQYGEKESFLLKNLCFALGAKFTEKAFKTVTHLLCKYASGDKYEVYTKRGTPTITAEWLFECVKQDTIIPFDHFQPKPLTSQDKEANLCTISQYSTQATGVNCSELLSGCQVTSNPTHNSGAASANEETIAPAVSKRRLLSVSGKGNDTCRNIRKTEKNLDSGSVPDVADAIEVLSSKIQDVQSPRSIFEPGNSAVIQDQKDTHSFGITRSWLNMQQKQDNTPGTKVQNLNSSPAPSPAPTTYYPFSETQTESQVVGYEEDLSGRQKIIDRVRSQSINVTPSTEIP